MINLDKKQLKIYVAMAGLFLLLVGLIAASALVTRRQEIRKEAVSASAELSLAPSCGEFNKDEYIQTTLKIDVHTERVPMAQIELEYDPAFLELNLNDVVYKSFLSEEINTYPKEIIEGPSNSKILKFMVYNISEQVSDFPTGLFDIATVKFKAKAVTSGEGTEVVFRAPSLFVLRREGDNTLSASPATATYKIKVAAGPTSTPTPTGEPVATNTPTPTPEQQTCSHELCQAAGYEGRACRESCMQDEHELTYGVCSGGRKCCCYTTGVGPTPTPIPTATSTPVPTGVPGQVKITLKVKFPGIDEQKPNQPVRIRIGKGGAILQEIASASLTANTEGIYQSEQITLSAAITPGSSYYFLVKGPKHLQVRYCQASGQTRPCTEGNINLVAGNNNLDFTGYALPAGDLPIVTTNGQDGVVDARDAVFLNNCFRDDPDSEDCISRADLDLDGKLGGADVGLMNNTIITRWEDE
jgi:hypothetical protein